MCDIRDVVVRAQSSMNDLNMCVLCNMFFCRVSLFAVQCYLFKYGISKSIIMSKIFMLVIFWISKNEKNEKNLKHESTKN